MILADKIIDLRKKCGWSQEELAEKLGVSRQSVSKWEGAQSTPDLERVLKLSEVFGVSVDVLLKDELPLPDAAASSVDESQPLRQLSMEEANDYLAQRGQAAKQIALATLLCILSPVCLILLSGICALQALPITEGTAVGLGMVVLLVMVALAVALYIACGRKNEPYEWLDKEPFETAYGVASMVRERKQRMSNVYTRSNMIATCLCILSVVPLFAVICITQKELYVIAAVCVLLTMVAVAVYLYVSVGVIWAGMQRILQEGEYDPALRESRRKSGAAATAFWLTAVAVYVGYSLITGDWERSWIVWPVAGVLYAALMVCMNAFVAPRDK